MIEPAMQDARLRAQLAALEQAGFRGPEMVLFAAGWDAALAFLAAVEERDWRARIATAPAAPTGPSFQALQRIRSGVSADHSGLDRVSADSSTDSSTLSTLSTGVYRA